MKQNILCISLLLLLCATPALAERQDYVSGTGNSVGGFSGTHTDPETGDIVNTIIAPRKSEQQEPWPPIYIYPQVTPQWPPTPGPVPVPPTPRAGTSSTGDGSPHPAPGSQWQSPFQYNERR